MKEDTLSKIGAVIIDELHMLAEPSRWVGVCWRFHVSGICQWPVLFKGLSVFPRAQCTLNGVLNPEQSAVTNNQHRGYLLEIMLTKLRFSTATNAKPGEMTDALWMH